MKVHLSSLTRIPIIVAALLLLSLCKIPSVSAAPALMLPVYRTRSVSVITSGYVQNLALGTFNITSPVVQETTEFFFVNSSYPRYLEVSKLSGSIWFVDYSKMLNPSYVPNLPSTNDALTKAQSFLTQHNLFPRIPLVAVPPRHSAGAAFVSFGNTTIETYTLTTHGKTKVLNSLDVLFGFQIVGSSTYPVEGPGAKIRVSLGDRGEVISVHWAWRQIEHYGDYPAITQSEAIERFRAFSMAESLNLTSVRLAYYAESGTDQQNFMQPFYFFDGYYVVHGKEIALKTQMIPATVFSPKASITKPSDFAVFTEGENVTFEASVVDGLPPYSYLWESDVDGIIGNTASFKQGNLSVAVRNQTITTHTITLTVIDANGMEATDSVVVTVAPKPGAVPEVAPWWQNTMLWIILGLVFIIGLALGYAAGSRRGGASSKGWTGVLLIVLLALSMVALFSDQVRAAPSDDGNTREVGIWWVNAYGGKGRLSNNHRQARGFAYKLRDVAGWTISREWGDWDAWERDFRYLFRTPPGYYYGQDGVQADSVDFAFFSGHGFAHGFQFCSNRDSQNFYCRDARWGGNDGGQSWEEGDLEWIVLDACNCLYHNPPNYDVFEAWGSAFVGLHYIFGFHSSCADTSDRGRKFAEKLVAGHHMWYAWWWATCETEGPGTAGAYLRAYTSTARTDFDTLYYTSPDPYPPAWLEYGWWTC